MLIVFRSPANAELENAIEWYNAASPELGDRFIAALDKTVSRVLRFPRAMRENEYGVRRARISGFTYGLRYRIENDQVVVYAVMHDKQEPNNWIHRLR